MFSDKQPRQNGRPETSREPQPKEKTTSNDHSAITQCRFGTDTSPGTHPSLSANKTGLPDGLKYRLESLSGYDLSDVRVHHRSPRPAQIGAAAYTRGKDIHLGPNQERHLGHEAWHVVQQMQDRVRPTTTIQGQLVNDSPALEREADRMGARAAAGASGDTHPARLGEASSPASREANGPIQGYFYFDNGEFGGKKIYQPTSTIHTDPIWDLLEATGEIKHGDKTRFRNLVRDENDVFPGQIVDVPTILARLKTLRPSKKRKRDEQPSPYYGRREEVSVGKKVDFRTDRFFRTERRLRRRMRRKGNSLGGRNIYMTRYQQGERRFKVVTSSHPPGGLPKDHSSIPDRDLAARLMPGHSEFVTENIEENLVSASKRRRIQERTTREQCKDCRHRYPGHPDADHGYGFPYSAPEDHIQSDELYKRIVANQGKISDLELTDEQRREFHQAKDSATWARQHDPLQNPLLDKIIADIEKQEEDSSSEFSDDEEDIFLDPFLGQHFEGETLGKAPLFSLSPGQTFSDSLLSEREKWIREQRESQSEKDKPSSSSAPVGVAIPGIDGLVYNVSGDGMNCLIRSVLFAATGAIDETFVNQIRLHLVGQGVADSDDMLNLAGVAGGILISYLVAQGTLDAIQGLDVYSLNDSGAIHINHVLPGPNPIRLWLGGDHFQAIR